MNRCRTCRFWLSTGMDDGWGNCHRLPPPHFQPDAEYPHGTATRPVVHEEDWCGEHRQLAFPRTPEEDQ